MADTHPTPTDTTPTDTTAGSDGLVAAAPEERGTLDVRTKALQHIVEKVVLDTAGTVERQRTLNKLVGSGSPRASITMEGRRARVSIDVDAVWPCNATRIAVDVRDRVLGEAVHLSGVNIRSVDVTVHLVDADDTDRDRNLQ